MQQIVNFILKYKYFLFFLFLEGIAISFTIKSHSYHNSKFSNSANFLSGGIFKRINRFKEYSTLRKSNKQLLEENSLLKNKLAQELKSSTSNIIDVIDTTKYFQKYKYTSAKVIDNQYQRKYNYLLIDKGSRNGIKTEMGVANSKGIIGITKNISDKYATILSILNENSKINVKLSNSFHFGTLEWNGDDYNVLQLVDLPIQANIKVGDSLITGGRSVIFPEGIPVGTVKDFKISNNNYNYINVQLFNDMSAIGPVYIIINMDQKEINDLQEKTIDD